MCERIEGRAGARETPVGYLPNVSDLNLNGLDLPPENIRELLRVDRLAWKAEVADIERHFARFDNRLPARLCEQLIALQKRLEADWMPPD